MSQEIANTPFWTKNVLTLDEASQYTGLSKGHIKNLTCKGRIPHSNPNGKRLFFDRVKLEKWLLGNPVKTTQEIEQQAYDHVNAKKSRKRTCT